jgi:hypothetical protein
MLIMRGLLSRQAGELFGRWTPGYEYQVRDEGGAALRADYHGKGVDFGDRIIVGDADRIEAVLVEYAVDAEPTVESVEYVAGYEHAIRQLRATFPAKRSEAFCDGWRAARSELAKETAEQRTDRLRAIKIDRMFRDD